jgi:hypothetical protein
MLAEIILILASKRTWQENFDVRGTLKLNQEDLPLRKFEFVAIRIKKKEATAL